MDSCGSVSLAHSKYLSNIKDCSQYNIPIVTLNGIGGSTLPITKAGVLTHVTPQRKLIKFLCYVFDTPIGKTRTRDDPSWVENLSRIKHRYSSPYEAFCSGANQNGSLSRHGESKQYTS